MTTNTTTLIEMIGINPGDRLLSIEHAMIRAITPETVMMTKAEGTIWTGRIVWCRKSVIGRKLPEGPDSGRGRSSEHPARSLGAAELLCSAIVRTHPEKREHW
jgi:hypothetical protein